MIGGSGDIHGVLGVTYGNGLFVAVGYNGTILTSPDGVSWTAGTSATNQTIDGITYGNGLFVAIGYTILTSPDGMSWTSRIPGIVGAAG